MRTRPAEIGDAAELAAAYVANRAFLAPYEPERPEAWFTEEGQAQVLAVLTAPSRADQGRAHVVVDDAGAIVGRISLANVIRGAFESCHLGYWVAEHANGRGYASQAVAEMLDLAFGELALHRVEASTLVDNVRSQRVLVRNGFTEIGVAPRYLQIGGRWRDHRMFQLTREDR